MNARRLVCRERKTRGSGCFSKSANQITAWSRGSARGGGRVGSLAGGSGVNNICPAFLAGKERDHQGKSGGCHLGCQSWSGLPVRYMWHMQGRLKRTESVQATSAAVWPPQGYGGAKIGKGNAPTTWNHLGWLALKALNAWHLLIPLISSKDQKSEILMASITLILPNAFSFTPLRK